MSSSSKLFLHSSTVQNVKGKIGSAIMLMMNSELNIVDSNLNGMTSIGEVVVGSAVINAQNSVVYIESSKFSSNQGNDIYSLTSPITVTGTDFEGITGVAKLSSFIYAEDTTVSITKTAMRNSFGPGNRGLRCNKCKDVDLSGNTFSQLYAIAIEADGSDGAAINIKDSCNIKIEDENKFSDL